jgi:NADH:ubiquinone oxidoreductase subunit 2 (subunit N)
VRTYDLLPEAIVVAAAIGLVLVARLPGMGDLRWRPWAALAAAVAALVAELWLGATIGTLFGGGWEQDRFSLFAKAALLLGLVTLIASADWQDDLTWEAVPLAFLAAFGGMVAASASSLVGLWAGLELAALTGVAAVGLAARTAGIRLLVVSAVAAALMAFGFAYLYAVAGTASLSGLSRALVSTPATLPLALAVLVLLAGLAVRLGLAPFQSALVESAAGGRSAAAAVMGSLVVGAAAVVAAKLLAALIGVNPAWATWLAWVAAITMLVSGLRALAAPSIQTLAAWLVVGQVGWVAAALAIHDRRGGAAALFLVGALLVAASAGPALAHAVQASGGPAGLGRRDPLRAAGLALALLSLAGAPPLAGSFGEFTVAAELVRSGMGWLLGAGLLGGVMAIAAVVRPLRAFYLESGPMETRRGPRVATTWTAGALVPALLAIVYGVFAYPIHDLAVQGATALGLR